MLTTAAMTEMNRQNVLSPSALRIPAHTEFIIRKNDISR